jgi:hypothetical protein
MNFFSQQELLKPFRGKIEIHCEPTSNGFLEELYKVCLVEASEFSAHCADRLSFARMVQNLLPNHPFHPKTKGLSEFLPNVEENILKEFSNPLVKPVASMASDGKGIFLYEYFLSGAGKRSQTIFYSRGFP